MREVVWDQNITLDGDNADKRGALPGEYHDLRGPRIEAIKSVTSWRVKFEEEERSKEIKDESIRLDEEIITRLSGRIQLDEQVRTISLFLFCVRLPIGQ